MLGAHLHARLGEARDQEVVGRERSRGPTALLPLGRGPTHRGHLVGERWAVQDDDHALADRDLLARRSDEPTPGGARDARFVLTRRSCSSGDCKQRRGKRERCEQG
jgi:hypothetical protein